MSNTSSEYVPSIFHILTMHIHGHFSLFHRYQLPQSWQFPFSSAVNFLSSTHITEGAKQFAYLLFIPLSTNSSLPLWHLWTGPLTHPYPCLWKFTPVSLLSGVPVHVTLRLVFHFLHSSGQNLFQVGFLGCGESSSGKSIYCAYKRIWVWVARTQMSNRI